jgi:cytochrome c-type biogenesis protein CcmH/NrfG
MSFFKTPKPRKFEYKPRFYDPKKEELEQLKAKYGPIEGNSYNRRINFRQAMQEKKDEKIKKPIPITKIILIAAVLMIALYFLLTFVETWK